MKQNPFLKYMDNQSLSVFRWALENGFCPSTLYAYYNGLRKPTRRLAIRIEKASRGKVSLRDWGYIAKKLPSAGDSGSV